MEWVRLGFSSFFPHFLFSMRYWIGLYLPLLLLQIFFFLVDTCSVCVFWPRELRRTNVALATRNVITVLPNATRNTQRMDSIRFNLCVWFSVAGAGRLWFPSSLTRMPWFVALARDSPPNASCAVSIAGGGDIFNKQQKQYKENAFPLRTSLHAYGRMTSTVVRHHCCFRLRLLLPLMLLASMDSLVSDG